MNKFLEWKPCPEPDKSELIYLAEWVRPAFSTNAGFYAVYADFFEPRVFYREHVGEERHTKWQRAEMDRPTL